VLRVYKQIYKHLANFGPRLAVSRSRAARPFESRWMFRPPVYWDRVAVVCYPQPRAAAHCEKRAASTTNPAAQQRPVARPRSLLARTTKATPGPLRRPARDRLALGSATWRKAPTCPAWDFSGTHRVGFTVGRLCAPFLLSLSRPWLFRQTPMPAFLRLPQLPFHQSDRSGQLLCDGRDIPERVHRGG
jgi:hypothetical protein